MTRRRSVAFVISGGSCLAVLLSVGIRNGLHRCELGTQLITAIEANNVGTVIQCLRRGADPNTLDGDRVAPLMITAAQGDTHAMELLLGAGADVNMRDSYGHTPLMWCAAGNSRPEPARILLRCETNINAVDDTGSTALMRAVSYRKYACAAELVARHADINVKDKMGTGAIDIARSNSDLKMVSVLLGSK